MRVLKRNQRALYYATYSSNSEIKDTNNHLTGERRITYSNPVLMYANISPARGEAEQELFGIDLDYDKVMITDDTSCPIAENSKLWVDTTPTIATGGSTTTVHDYVVKRVSRSINSIAYAIEKVKKTYVAPPTP